MPAIGPRSSALCVGQHAPAPSRQEKSRRTQPTTTGSVHGELGRGAGVRGGWSRLGSNQRPSACEADALPLSHGTGAERRTTSKTSTTVVWAERPRPGELLPGRIRHALTKEFVWAGSLDYRRASHRATISPVARGCSAVGSASPCQGEGRGFESRHPLEGANWHQSPAVEWPSGEATACKAVHTGSIPVSTSDFDLPARLAQRESASLTRKRSLVQSQYRAPEFLAA